MNILQAIILGIIQGITEFLPISSSAHLVLIPYFAGWKLQPIDAFSFDVFVHLGTLLAILIFFWRDIVKIVLDFITGVLKGKPFAEPRFRLGWWLLLASVPAGVVGVIIKKLIEGAFESPFITGACLMGTAILLLAAEYIGKKEHTLQDLTWQDALWIGCFQMIALFPGISRSGATLTGGMLRQLNREEAARFSFLLAIPVTLGAGLLQLFELLQYPALAVIDTLPVVITGLVVSAVVGYFAIYWLLKFIKQNSLIWFSAYCFLLGAAAMFISFYIIR